MTPFQKQCAQYLADFACKRLLDRTGLRLSAEARGLIARTPGHMGGGVALAAAFLTQPDRWDGPPLAVRALEDFARRSVSAQARALAERCARPSFPPNFDLLPLVPAMEILLPRAAAAERRLWIDAARTFARALSGCLLKKEAAWGLPGPHTGCGPNHLFIMAAPLHRIGVLLGDGESRRLARRAMRALCRLQSPEGYFPEDSGPVVNYHRVNMFGLTDYRRTSEDRFVDPVLASGMGYLTRAMYPNLACIETLDQRNRSGLRVGHPGRAPQTWDVCFGQSPAGRRLAELALAVFQERLAARPEAVEPARSEERRVGKEWRSRCAPYP